MKKKIIISSLITLLAIPTFAGCDSNSTSSNQITSSNSQGVVTEKAKLNEMLNTLRSGVEFEGTITQKRSILDGYYGNKTGKVETILFDAEYIFEMADENGYSSVVTIDEGNGKELIIDNKVFEGDDGYAYFYDLHYDNTVRKYPIYDEQSGDKVNFGYYCLNPFEYILAEDFTKVNENTYSLNKAKAAFFAANVFGQIDFAFNRVIDKCEFVLEGSTLKSFTLVPQEVHSQYTNYEELSAVYYYSNNEAKFDIVATGSQAKVSRPEPKVAKEEHAALQNAFSKFASKNFTAYLHIDYEDGYGDKLGENFLYYYYDGEALYFSATEDQSEHDSQNSNYFAPNKQGMIYIDETYVTYDQLVPKISEVKAELFNYNAEKDVYSVCDEMVSYMGYIALVPPISTITLMLDGYTTYFDIKLDENGDLSYIDFGYVYEYYLSMEIATCRLEFYDVGTTKIPHGLKSYE